MPTRDDHPSASGGILGMGVTLGTSNLRASVVSCSALRTILEFKVKRLWQRMQCMIMIKCAYIRIITVQCVRG